jgi:hypothetical protein
MSAFIVESKNQPGHLARLCEAMAARDVNIILSGVAHDDSGTVAFVADDEAVARTALESAGIEFTEREALTVRLENVVGAGAAMFRALADANVNIELLLPVRVSDEHYFAVICAQNLDVARLVLGEQVISPE